MSTKIIILSDTHANNTVIDQILKSNNYDFAIHAGDYECDINFMIKNFDFFVRGNHDFDSAPQELYFNISGFSFYLQHGHLIGSYNNLDNNTYMEKIIKEKNSDILIHGHTHKTKIVELTNNKFIINPGSTTLPRGNTEATYIIAYIENKGISFEIKKVKDLGDITC